MTTRLSRIPIRILFGSARTSVLLSASRGFGTPGPLNLRGLGFFSRTSAFPAKVVIQNSVRSSPGWRPHSQSPYATARLISFTSNRSTTSGIAKLLPTGMLQGETSTQSANLSQLVALAKPEKKALFIAFGLVRLLYSSHP
jgi:hypothetical protein